MNTVFDSKPKSSTRPKGTVRTGMKRFAKYPSCFGDLCLGALCSIARRHGMYVITASRPNMHCYNEIGLYGTTEQMKAVTEEWAAHGNVLKPRSFRAVFEINKNIPAANWLDIPAAHREWCADHHHRCRNHCDFDSKLSRAAISQLEKIRARVQHLEARNK
jgi:hypothetical protein